jgi:hypothetical protein
MAVRPQILTTLRQIDPILVKLEIRKASLNFLADDTTEADGFFQELLLSVLTNTSIQKLTIYLENLHDLNTLASKRLETLWPVLCRLPSLYEVEIDGRHDCMPAHVLIRFLGCDNVDCFLHVRKLTLKNVAFIQEYELLPSLIVHLPRLQSLEDFSWRRFACVNMGREVRPLLLTIFALPRLKHIHLENLSRGVDHQELAPCINRLSSISSLQSLALLGFDFQEEISLSVASLLRQSTSLRSLTLGSTLTPKAGRRIFFALSENLTLEHLKIRCWSGWQRGHEASRAWRTLALVLCYQNTTISNVQVSFGSCNGRSSNPLSNPHWKKVKLYLEVNRKGLRRRPLSEDEGFFFAEYVGYCSAQPILSVSDIALERAPPPKFEEPKQLKC